MTSPPDGPKDPRQARGGVPGPPAARGNENPTIATPGPRSVSGRPTPRPTTAPAPTYVFGGKYELLEELGSGGMGVVFHARDMRLRRDVAIKLVDLGPRPSADMVERFGREARTTARLRHPAIVSVHDFGEFNGRHYLVMDLVQGKSLGERIQKKDLPLREAIEVVRMVAEGIAHAHAAGVIHRDLKPDNVLVDKDGKGYVTDFGLAKEAGSRTALTKTGMAIGTAVYMSPEAAAGQIKAFGPRTDVYGLGAILYEVLAGQPPFAGESTVQILASVMSNDPLPPTRLCPDVPRDLEVVCRKAMEKEPSLRYPSAKEFADELGRWLDGEAIRARPTGTIATILRTIRRRRPWLAGVAALLAALAGALGMVLWKSNQEKQRLEEAATYFQQGLGRSQTPGGLRDAVALYDRALTIRPDYMEALLARGNSRLMLGEAQGAADDLERAVVLDPASADAWYQLGRVAGEVPSRRNRAKAALEKGLAIAPSHGSAPLARARLAWIDGDRDAAVRLCDEAEKALGNDEDVHFLRGTIAATEGDSRAAIEHFTKGLQVRPESWRCLVNRACEHMELGEKERALADRDRAIQISPDGVEAWANRAFCLVDLGRLEEAQQAIARVESLPKSSRVRVGLLRSQLLEAQKKYEEALSAISAEIAENPLEAETRVVRARVLKTLGRLPEALEDAAKAVEVASQDAGARCMYAELLCDAKRWEEATKQVDAVLERNTDVPAALFLRSRAKLAQADRAAARADLERAYRLSPADRNVAMSLGQLLIDAGDSAAARKVFEELLKAHPDHGDAAMSLGLMEIEAGRIRTGFGRLGEVLAENKENALMLANVGTALSQLSANGIALEFLNRAVEIDPTCGVALHNRGSLRIELGDVDGGLADLDADIALGVATAGSRCEKAEALWKRGEVQRALEEVERSVQEDPQVVYHRTVLALLLAAAGKLDRAALEAEQLLAKEGADARLLFLRVERKIADGQGAAAAEDLGTLITAMRDEGAVIRRDSIDLPQLDWERFEAAVASLVKDPELEGAVRSSIAAFRIARGRPAEARALLEEVIAAAPDDTGAMEILVQAHVDLGEFEEAAVLLEACARKVQDPEEAKVIQVWQDQVAPLRRPPVRREDRLLRIDSLVFWNRFELALTECSEGISEIEKNPTGAGLEKIHLGRYHLSHATVSAILATHAPTLKEHQAHWSAAAQHAKKAIELGALVPAELPEDALLLLPLLELPLPR